MGKFSLYIIFKSILSKKNRIYLTLFFVIACVITLIIYSNRWSSNISISQITVSGNRLLSKSEILSSLDNSIYQLKNKDIQLLKIKSEVEKISYVEKAYVMRISPSEIAIKIKEREPFAILVGPNCELLFVDKNAVILPYRVLPYLRDMPFIRNVINLKTKKFKALAGAIEFLNDINKGNNIALTKYISDIIYNANSKNYTCLTSWDFCKILFGKAINVKEKVELLESFWNNKLADLDMKKIEYIDLRWENRVVVKFLT